MTTGELTAFQKYGELEMEWKIMDPDCPSMEVENDACHVSSTISLHGEKWCLEMWPNGKEDRNTVGHIDVGLRRSSSGALIYGRFSFALKTVNGEEDLRRQSTEAFGDWCSRRFDRFLSKPEYERRKSEFLVSGHLTVICTLSLYTVGIAFLHVRRMLGKTVKENDNIKAELHAYKTDRLYLEDDLKTTKENLVIVTQEKEQLSRDLTDEISSLNTEINNLLKSNRDLTRERDESVMKYKKSLEDSSMENIQLKEQLLAVSQELETEKNEKEHLRSAISIMEKKIYELQSTAQDNIALNSVSGTKQNGTMEVSTEVNINKAEKSETAESNESKHQNDETKEPDSPEVYSIVVDVNYLLEERKGVDVTFSLEISDGYREVFAHQLILAVRSSYFADEFYSKEANQEHKIIPLKGVDPKAFEKMIRYCYDCKPGLKTTEEACALFEVAFEFKMISIVNLCTTFLKSTKIEAGNVLSVLQISEQMEDKSLTDICLKVLQEKTLEVMASYELCDVTPSMVHVILKLPKLSLNSEYELILWILDWAKLKTEDKGLNCKSTRDFLGNLLRDMNFLSLTGEEFAKFCKNHPDFFTLEEMASLSLNIIIPGTREMPAWYNKDVRVRVYTGTKK